MPSRTSARPMLVQPLDHLVAVGLPLGEQLQQEQRQDALEQLRIVGRGHPARLYLLQEIVK